MNKNKNKNENDKKKNESSTSKLLSASKGFKIGHITHKMNINHRLTS